LFNDKHPMLLNLREIGPLSPIKVPQKPYLFPFDSEVSLFMLVLLIITAPLTLLNQNTSKFKLEFSTEFR